MHGGEQKIGVGLTRAGGCGQRLQRRVLIDRQRQPLINWRTETARLGREALPVGNFRIIHGANAYSPSLKDNGICTAEGHN
jgi:hypothetical protein